MHKEDQFIDRMQRNRSMEHTDRKLHVKVRLAARGSARLGSVSPLHKMDASLQMNAGPNPSIIFIFIFIFISTIIIIIITTNTR